MPITTISQPHGDNLDICSYVELMNYLLTDTLVSFMHTIFNIWWNHCAIVKAFNISWVYLSYNFQLHVAVHEITAADGQVIHLLQTGLFIMCMRTQIHTKIPPLREWGNMVWSSRKSCTLTKMCHTVDERYPLCTERGARSIVSKINQERKKKSSFRMTSARAKQIRRHLLVALTMIWVEFFNIAKEARQCSDIQMRSSVNVSVRITVRWEQFVFVSACV